MWIFTKTGFISVVKHTEKADFLLVRARRREDLEAIVEPMLASGYPLDDITETPEADYRFRVVMPRDCFAVVMSELVDQIDYPNFKDSIPKTKPGYATFAGRTWWEGLNYQRTAPDNFGNGNPHVDLS